MDPFISLEGLRCLLEVNPTLVIDGQRAHYAIDLAVYKGVPHPATPCHTGPGGDIFVGGWETHFLSLCLE